MLTAMCWALNTVPVANDDDDSDDGYILFSLMTVQTWRLSSRTLAAQRPATRRI